MTADRRAGRLAAATVIVWIVLVATHAGEFFPFSIYPMFSAAGRPWTRAVVRVVGVDALPSWDVVGERSLAGAALPLRAVGVDQNDLTALVQRDGPWDTVRREALRDLIGAPDTEAFVVYAAHGDLDGVRYQPVAVVTASAIRVRP